MDKEEMESYSYMCGTCFQVYTNIDVFQEHVCSSVDMANTEKQREQPEPSQEECESGATVSCSESSEAHSLVCKVEDPDSVVVVRMSEAWEAEADQVTVLVSDKPTLSGGEQHQGQSGDIVNEEGQREKEEDRGSIKRKKCSSQEEEEAEEDEEGGSVKKRKKYQVMDDSYRLNRIMRDKDFKLGRSSYYSFKDTLGDWDERSTRLLLLLIGRYPYTHFLLPSKTEKRLGHWERVHTEMEAAGYNFTILQLRMRWREVLQKYRWTVDYNDQHKIQKTCEFFDEMNDLFGDWDGDATRALLRQMHQIKAENHTKKIVRIGYAGWQKITDSLCNEGHRFTMNKVEGRWRNLVTLYKTSVDRNVLPNVEPRRVAFHSDLEALVRYVPQRRHNYEKKKGRSVVMERFPTSASRTLLQAYKDSINNFMDPNINNREVWDDIRQKLELEGHRYSTLKLKEILTGMIKGYEKCQHHNSLPGAIRRDVPFFRELAEVFGVHGHWPHLQTSRTLAMKATRKFKHRLQVSQQLWRVEESRALLEVYPGVLESHASSHGHASQPSHLWLQLAKAYAQTGHLKRDVPEVAVHIGLLRQGYAQANKFPFVEEMRRVRETEEAVCYSPDVSKFTGDVEITYWSHEAVGRLLDLYLHHQATSPAPARRGHVLSRVTCDLQADGYRYTLEEVREQFHALLTQYNTRNTKPWMPPPAGRHTHNPMAAPYLDRLHQVLELRRSLSLSWTTGVKPLSEGEQRVVLSVARDKAEEELMAGEVVVGPGEEQRVVARLVEAIVTHIRTHRLLQPVPRTRQVRLHLADTLRNFEEKEEEVEKEEEGKESDRAVRRLHYLLSQSGLLSAVCDVPLEATTYTYNGSKILPVRRRKRQPLRTTRKYGNQCRVWKAKKQESSDEEECVDDPDEDQVSDGKEWEEDPSSNTQEQATDIASEYLTLALQYLTKEVDLERQEASEGEAGADEARLFRNRKENNGKDRVPILKGTQSFHNKGTVTQKKADWRKLRDSGQAHGHHTSHSQDQGEDIFGKLFSQVHNIVPKTCTKEAKGNLYSFSCCINSNLYLYLPPDFNLCAPSSTGRSNLRSRKDGPAYGRQRHPGCRRLSETSITESEEDARSGNEYMSTEEENEQRVGKSERSESQKNDPETKVIQTRSGRKTRFTFFSRTLIDDDAEEISSLAATPKTRRPEQETTVKPSTPGKKRGRPRKVKDEDSVMKCKVVEDAEAPVALQNVSKAVEEKEGRRQTGGLAYSGMDVYEEHGRKREMDEENDEGGGEKVCEERERKGQRQKSEGREKRKEEHSGNSDDPLVAFMREQEALRRRREENLVVVMKQHQTVRNTVLTEMLNVLHSIKAKLERS